MEIKNKVALVLGASRGIGLALARALADEGAKVVLPYHNDWKMNQRKCKRSLPGLAKIILPSL